MNSLELSQQHNYGMGLKGAKPIPAGDKMKMYITLGTNKQAQLGVNEFTTTSQQVQANGNSLDGDLDVSGIPASPAKKSQALIATREIGYKTLNTEGGCINFALPQPKSLRKRQLDQPQRIQLASNGVTMYVGCIDTPEKD